MMAQSALSVQSCHGDLRLVQKAICAGLFINVAKRALLGNDIYNVIIKGQPATLHPGSNLIRNQPAWIVYSDLVHTKNKYMRNVSQSRCYDSQRPICPPFSGIFL